MKKFLRSPGPRVPRRATDTSLELDPGSLPKASAVRKAKLHKAREAAEETPSPRRRPLPRATRPQRIQSTRPQCDEQPRPAQPVERIAKAASQPPAQPTPAESSPEPRPENEISRALARRSQPVGTPTSKQLKTPRPSREQRQAARQDNTKGADTPAVPKESATVTRQRRARLRPVPGLDGLRGLAVLAVVIYHFFGDLLPGGYLGVDMFFVLSGFLITSLLVREFAVTGRISLTDFWIRRFRRILPAALVVLCLCTALVAMIGGDLAVGIREQFLGTFFFVNNWTQIATSQTYFAPNEVQVFAHYWSLAVEEQFYLLWPLLMFGAFALSRRQPKRLPIALSLVLAAASAAAMALLFTPGEDPTRVYYGTDTHAFGLLIGALLSLLLTSTSKEAKADSWASTSTGVIAGTIGSFALIGYLTQLVWMGADLEFTYRGGLVLTSLLGAAMIWGVVRETGPLTWLFRTRVMRWLGQRSFSLYLWHWPVVMILRELSDAPAWLLGLLALPVSCLLAEVTYQFVENPFRRAGYVATWRTYWASRPTVGEMKEGFGKAMWPAVPAMVIFSALGVAYGLVTSQDQTELERELERMSQANEQAAASAPATPTETTKPKEKRALPAGTEINAVGDSVMLAASEALNERFPGILIDAAVSRQYGEAIPAIRQLKDSEQLRSTVFVGLGTNGPAADGEMDELLTILGSDRTVILVVPYGERDWMGQARAEIIEAAKEHDNVYVADWCGMAQENPALLYDDGVHPQAEGAALYVQALSDALEQYANGDKSSTTACSL
ncbi:acyltransferase family protein [Corynebacterium sp. HMSC074A09]|uniref:acyltransferase family protein n=1 Tax=Corynebacterium sp. HMSC074A09 TaxID=1739311 RepID=UPI000A3D9525|nr:acyltransferase family protein [Corynebacterium sp. HMSC074A09]